MNQMQVIEVVKKLTGRDVVLSPMYRRSLSGAIGLLVKLKVSTSTT